MRDLEEMYQEPAVRSGNIPVHDGREGGRPPCRAFSISQAAEAAGDIADRCALDNQAVPALDPLRHASV